MCCVMQTIRTSLLDLREKAYERSGQGSSYLFRVDENWAVDATRQVRFTTAQAVTKQIQDVLLRLAITAIIAAVARMRIWVCRP